MTRLISLLLLALVLVGSTHAQAPLLPATEVRQLFVYVAPVWSVDQQAIWAEDTITALYDVPRRYEWWPVHGAWFWSIEAGVELTAFHTYFATPTAFDAQQIITLAQALTGQPVDWSRVEAGALTMGKLGLRTPRLELVFWYTDGSLRHLVISQTETVAGGLYALVFGHIASRADPHPLGLYRLDEAQARALVTFAAHFVE